jgi:hypothetical protein
MALGVTIGLDIAKAAFRSMQLIPPGKLFLAVAFHAGASCRFSRSWCFVSLGSRPATGHIIRRGNSSHAGTMSGCSPFSMCGPKRRIVRFAPSSVVTAAGPPTRINGR